MITRLTLSTDIAPFTGAWIETVVNWKSTLSKSSHPSRVRGLKPGDDGRHQDRGASHPSRVRGLKPVEPLVEDLLHRIAPFTGAWIETVPKRQGRRAARHRTLHGCVD